MIYDFPDQYTCSTWNGVSSISITSGGTPLDLTNREIVVKVRSAFNLASPTILEFNNKDGTLIILNASQGIIKIPPQNINIPEGKYRYSLKISTPPNEHKTYLTGVWNILPSVTRVPITTRVPIITSSNTNINYYIPDYSFTFTPQITSDTDNDQYTDISELSAGTDPNNSNDFPQNLFNVFNDI